MEILNILNKEILKNTQFSENTQLKDFDDQEEEEITYYIKNQKIYKERQDKSLIDLKRMIDEEDIILQPNYQRGYVWTKQNASSFIESLFMSIPIPTIFVSENKNNKWEVIDGQQRLVTIMKFFNNVFSLNNKLPILEQLSGKKFQDLDEEIQRFFSNQITLQIVIIKKETDSNIKYDIFSRINKGSISLNSQELRNCLYRGNLNELLKKIAKNTGNKYPNLFSKNMHIRMNDIEVILRFFAMRKIYNNNDNFDSYKGLTTELNNFMDTNKNLTEDKILELENLFNNAFNKVDIVFGENKFKYYDTDKNSFNNLINKSILEIQMCILNEYSLEDIKSKKDKIFLKFLEFFEDKEFQLAVRIHTNNINAIRKRFNVMKKNVFEIMKENEYDENFRNF